MLYQNPGKHYNYGKAEFVEVDKTQALTFLWKQMLMGDSTDGIQGIPKVGPKTADTWLKSLIPSEMPEFVLNKYIEKFGVAEGISKFAETFKLIYMLKSKEDVLRETGVILGDVVLHDVKLLNSEDLWQ